MDLDIGNILYIVIAAVVLITSLLGKKKKPAGKSAKPGFLENLEKMLTMEQENQVVTDLQDHEPDMEVEIEDPEKEDVTETSGLLSEAPSLMEEYEKLLASSGGSVEMNHFEGERSTEQMEVMELEDIEEEGNDYFEIIRDFDAGTAVVYSTIINRLDY